MKRSLLLILAAALPLLAWADLLTFAPLRVGKSYAGPVVVAVTWADGSTRDVSTATGSLTVYRTAPSNGVGGTVLFTKSLTPSGTGTMSLTVTATDTALPGSFYVELAITDAGITDTWHGTWVTEGR